MKKIYYILFLLALAGCDSFLDKLPDNRTEIDNQEKIQALLTSAYPPTDYMLVTEFMSDNVDDYGVNNPETDRFIDEVFAWKDVTESDNEDPESIWEASYHAIACANEVLQSIDSLMICSRSSRVVSAIFRLLATGITPFRPHRGRFY